MKSAPFVATMIAFAGVLSACERSTPQPSPAPITRPAPSKDADNTAQNRRDRDGNSVTPMDQSNSAGALRISADIRKALVDDASLSTDAHNIKIITDDAGVVTLRGVVASQAEKDAIAAKARAVAGVSSVVNQLEVKGG